MKPIGLKFGHNLTQNEAVIAKMTQNLEESFHFLSVTNYIVGDKVQKGQVVCIIETMKLMNEIETRNATGLVAPAIVAGLGALTHTLGTLIP
ncbi:hypothetical protein ACSBR2_006404 [Camellia fascicularis]